MEIIQKFFDKTFFNEKSSKAAYLEASKWIAINILNDPSMKDIIPRVEKDIDAANTFRVTLYATINRNDFKNNFCDKCKEYHHAFFINQDYNCDNCRITAYHNQAKMKLAIIKNAKAKVLNIHIMSKEED